MKRLNYCMIMLVITFSYGLLNAAAQHASDEKELFIGELPQVSIKDLDRDYFFDWIKEITASVDQRYFNLYPGLHFPDGKTLLHQAASKNSLSALQLLIELGAWLNVEDDQGNKPWMLARQESKAYKYLKRCLDLIAACKRGHWGVARAALKQGAYIHVLEGPTYGTPLHLAVALGDAKMVQLLLSFGADVGRKNSAGYPAVHFLYSKQGVDYDPVALVLQHKIRVECACGLDHLEVPMWV